MHLWEDPVFTEREKPMLAINVQNDGLRVLTPLLPAGINDDEVVVMQRKLLDGYISEQKVGSFIAWYYTPMALRFSDHLSPELVVYDCMDELSAFQGAPAGLLGEEARLFRQADVIFTGGASLYASKKYQHHNVHLFPSSIDHKHFAAARGPLDDPHDQAGIARPRIGFFGVLDERLDRNLLTELAEQHSEWQFVLLGPVVKIDPRDLPRRGNIHYLGQKSYAELPAYIANWDVAILPFARNAATQFISPTKTPEYLAAGKPVVSTPIRDVVTPYGDLGMVRIGADSDEFAAAIEQSLAETQKAWLQRADQFLSRTSWDKTFEDMWTEIQRLASRSSERTASYASVERSGANV